MGSQNNMYFDILNEFNPYLYGFDIDEMYPDDIIVNQKENFSEI